MATSDRWPNGYVKVYLNDNSAILLPRATYSHFAEDVRAGKTFWEGEDAYGDLVLVRLVNVNMVQDVSFDGLVRYEAEASARNLDAGSSS